MLKSNLSEFFQMGATRTMSNHQLDDETGLQSSGFAKAPILCELGRVARSAYEQGVTLEEAYAICGAAYGDWREADEVRSQELFEEEASRARR